MSDDDRTSADDGDIHGAVAPAVEPGTATAALSVSAVGVAAGAEGDQSEGAPFLRTLKRGCHRKGTAAQQRQPVRLGPARSEHRPAIVAVGAIRSTVRKQPDRAYSISPKPKTGRGKQQPAARQDGNPGNVELFLVEHAIHIARARGFDYPRPAETAVGRTVSAQLPEEGSDGVARVDYDAARGRRGDVEDPDFSAAGEDAHTISAERAVERAIGPQTSNRESEAAFTPIDLVVNADPTQQDVAVRCQRHRLGVVVATAKRNIDAAPVTERRIALAVRKQSRNPSFALRPAPAAWAARSGDEDLSVGGDHRVFAGNQRGPILAERPIE